MRIKLNGLLYNNVNFQTIYRFSGSRRIPLPNFCYHEKLMVAGNCRACMVEVNSRLAVSCCVPLIDNMLIYTNTSRVIKARKYVIEFLLANHPLDCPVCDLGGECDLQDISNLYGSEKGRFYESNQTPPNNLDSLGPIIKTVMTRCIRCTRCTRFAQELLGSVDLGITGRGKFTEISTYVVRYIDNELLGNIIDLCPVGALTSMPFAFSARSWEIDVHKSIDIFDAIASSIRIDVRNNKIKRILPCLDENLNEEWITNKTRFVYDSLNKQRLIYPKININSKFIVLG